jgi:hypothetical protein
MTIFDLEQQIMGCWTVVDDIGEVCKHIGNDTGFASIEPEVEDEIMNLLLGLKSIYQMKFQNLQNSFEEHCEEFHEYRRQCTGQLP